jgi:dihydropteroate synthase
MVIVGLIIKQAPCYYRQKYRFLLMFTLNCKGKFLMLTRPLVMGIINATPDSFYKEHSTPGHAAAFALAEKMIRDGADILDIGGQSTRPGSERISAAEEIQRVLPLVQQIRDQYPNTLMSVDTYHARVAEAAVLAGATIVNDISGGDMDPGMISMVAGLKVPYICMHMKGTPENMQKEPQYNDVVSEVLDYFINKIAVCKEAGIHDVIIDPGFGFGKTIAHNLTLLKSLPVFRILERPILAAISRKGTIYKTLGSTPAEALNGTTVLNTLAIKNGASLLRVHDVKEAREVITLLEAYEAAPVSPA